MYLRESGDNYSFVVTVLKIYLFAVEALPLVLMQIVIGKRC